MYKITSFIDKQNNTIREVGRVVFATNTEQPKICGLVERMFFEILRQATVYRYYRFYKNIYRPVDLRFKSH